LVRDTLPDTEAIGSTFCFTTFLDQSLSNLGGLKASVVSDFKCEEVLAELHVLALIGEFLTSPWMKKIYTSRETELNHVEGIAAVRKVHDNLRKHQTTI
jgi:hypothetical protein